MGKSTGLLDSSTALAARGKRSSSARWSSAVDGVVREWDPVIELAVNAARAEEGRVADLGVWV